MVSIDNFLISFTSEGLNLQYFRKRPNTLVIHYFGKHKYQLQCKYLQNFRMRFKLSFGASTNLEQKLTGDPLHSRALAHSRAPLLTQPCPHCSHSRAPGEQWARLCVFTLQGCVQAARLCRGSPVKLCSCNEHHPCDSIKLWGISSGFQWNIQRCYDRGIHCLSSFFGCQTREDTLVCDLEDLVAE